MKKLISLLIMLFLLSTGSIYPQQTYVLIGWNDLGMHCANKDFSKMAVLPPYNNVYAQLILKQTGQLPQIVNTGYKIEYNIPNNTYSVGKTNFWTYAQELFGLPNPLPDNIGLTGKGLTGLLDTIGSSFRVVGVPVTPYPDNDLVNEHPFQLIHLAAKPVSGTNVLAYTDVVIPVSNEIGCVQSGCHSSEQAIKNAHENVSGFKYNSPELCARCHASPALGTPGIPEAKYFSFRMHDTHSFIQPVNDISVCYKCHPGPNTQCLRDTMRYALVCQNCHGTMAVIAQSIDNGRTPWLSEPRCGNTTCHGSNFSEETGKLYRESKGHGGLYCSACHGSPHTIFPSREANDNQQSIRLQGHAGAISNCLVCHSSAPTGPGPHGFTYIGIKQISSEIPNKFELLQNYPNPFNPSTKIAIGIHKTGFVNMKVYDMEGREVRVLANREFKAGSYEIEWDAGSLSSGMYICRVEFDGNSKSIKMVLVR